MASRTSLIRSKTMFRRWSECSSRLNSSQVSLASNLMTMRHSLMSRILEIILLNSKSIFLISLRWWLIRKTIRMQPYHLCHLRGLTRRSSTKEIFSSMLLMKRRRETSQVNPLKRVMRHSTWMTTTSSILKLCIRTSLISSPDKSSILSNNLRPEETECSQLSKSKTMSERPNI